MKKKLNEILIEVETNKFEQDMWNFAVNKYFSLSNKYDGEKFNEKFNESLNDKLGTSKRNTFLLEHINIDYTTNTEEDEELNKLIETFESTLNELGLNETETENSNKNVTDNTTSSENKPTTLADKWNNIKKYWKSMLDTFKEWMNVAKLSTLEIITVLTNDGFINAFKTTSIKLFKGLQKLLNLWSDNVNKIQNFLFKGLKESGVGKSLDEISAFLDKKLNQENDVLWKKVARISIGIAVVWLTYYIWTKMFFIGDWKYDFDYSEAIGTITGAVDFQSVLGADWIPTLAWFIAGIVSNSFNLTIPCPPNCAWFGSTGNMIAAGFVTAYIICTNGSLEKIKNSNIGTKIRSWLKTIKRDETNTPVNSPQGQLLIKKGGLLKPI